MRIFQGKILFFYSRRTVSLVLFVFGLVSTGHGEKTSRRRQTRSPKMLSKTPLSQIQSTNPVSSQQNELKSIIDTMNKALMQNQEI